MHGLALLIVGAACAYAPIEVENDVWEIESRDFQMPLHFDPARWVYVDHVEFYVSEDHGKIWKHEKDYTTKDAAVLFHAPHDGPYWFALRVILKGGKAEPVGTDELVASQKGYVITDHVTLKRQKSYEELSQECDDIGKRLDKLEQEIDKLEADRKGK